MRKKTLTIDCPNCSLLKIDDKNQFICQWGKGKEKILEPHRGKRPKECKLRR
jgi:hypothetical protein